MPELLTCECVEAMPPLDRLTQIYATLFELAGDDTLPAVECVAGKPPWSRLDDIYCAARAWSGDDSLSSCVCVAGLTVSDRLTAIYEALFIVADNLNLLSVECVDGLTLSEKFTAIYEAVYDVAGFDPAALDFFDRAGITNVMQKDAINALVLGLRAEGIWDKFFALYPFVGGNAAAHSENLISSSFPITWNGTVTHNSNGITGNGTNGYGNCIGLDGSIIPALCGFTVYNRTTNAQSSGVTMRFCGIQNAAATGLWCLDYTDIGGFESNRGCIGAVASFVGDSSLVEKIGTISASRISATDFKSYNNGVQYLTSAVNSVTVVPVLNMFILATNNNGSVENFSSDNLALASVHEGFTTAESVSLNTLVQAYETALGRNV
jgi:hypothetical protein